MSTAPPRMLRCLFVHMNINIVVALVAPKADTDPEDFAQFEHSAAILKNINVFLSLPLLMSVLG